MRKLMSVVFMMVLGIGLGFLGPGYCAEMPKVIHVGNAGAFTGDAAAPCMECGHAVAINKPAWAISGTRLCIDCGGPWKRRNGAGSGSLPLEVYTTLSEDTPQLLDLSIGVVGIVPGSVLEIQDETSAVVMIRISGSLSTIFV